jgi:diguanylate cyclase (GGDEF)-like protein
MSGEDSLKRMTVIITTGYILALGLLAALTIGIHLLLNQAVTELQHAGKVVNVAGAQRMLSQRIYWMTEELGHGTGDPEALTAAIDRFENSHRSLIYGDLAAGLPRGVSEDLRAYYFEKPHDLDVKVRQYIDLARSGLVLGVDEYLVEEMRPMAAADLLESLDAAVQAYENQVSENVAQLQDVQSLSVAAVILVLTLEAVFIFRPLVGRVRRYAAQLYDLATRDSMTGLLNRRTFMEIANRSERERRRNPFPISIVMFDIDHFKAVNDTYGHAIGDDVIVRTASLAEEIGRDADLAARIGGEEFVVLLPHTELEGARIMAERLRVQIEADTVAAPSGAPNKQVRWTISLGAVELADGETIEAGMIRADALLYEAKNGGRNQVRAA